MTCDGCATGEVVLMGEHVHCPTCDGPMLTHPWATCGTCNPGPAVVIEAAEFGSTGAQHSREATDE